MKELITRSLTGAVYVGLTLGACVSIALWTFIGLGVRALTA